MRNFAHFINLGRVGGIERLYSYFINHQSKHHSVSHHTILTRHRVAPPLLKLVQKGSRSTSFVKQFGFLKLPRYPKCLRLFNQNRILKRIKPDIIMLWSNPTAVHLHELRTSARIVYYEHGAVWFNRKFEGLDRQLTRIDGIICNSNAAKRMIQQRWPIGDHIQIDVCLNAVSPDCQPQSVQTKNHSGQHPFRLGIAGRMTPVKGFVLALHALRVLIAKGLPCRLMVAGSGSDRIRLEGLAKSLEIDNYVSFLGFVDDMARFYSSVDCLICPSIREPFGLVCAEAMANGCPVIAAKVDGLPEVVDHLNTGICISPSLPLDQYEKYGGNAAAIPRFVYNPETDSIEVPKILEPEAIAAAVESLMTDNAAFNRMSQTAITRVHDKFRHSQYVECMFQLLA